MQIKNFIPDISPLVSVHEKGENALAKMDFYKVSHLPLVDAEGNYFGVISENEIYDFDLIEKTLSAYKNVLARPYIYENEHVYSLINLFSELSLSLIPVLNKQDKFIGAVCFYDLMKYFKRFTASDNPGTVFILELDYHNYSLSQIAQIIESNNAKVLSLFTETHKDSTKLNITIKLNTTDFSAIRQTFERYDYKIKAAYSENDKVNELLEGRYEEFMNYLNI